MCINVTPSGLASYVLTPSVAVNMFSNVDVLKSGFSLANASGELQKLMRGSLPPWCQARESKRLGQATHRLRQNIIATSKQTEELRDNCNPNNLHKSKDAHRPKPSTLVNVSNNRVLLIFPSTITATDNGHVAGV